MFAKASRIFFGEESILTECLNQLHLEIARNKSSFKNEIALDEFFVAKFMFAIDQRVQRWLKSCERAENFRNKVNDKCLDLDDVIEQVLNKAFTMTLPPAFTKVKTEATVKKNTEGKHKGGKGKEGKGRKKQKSKDGKGTGVTNTTQPAEFKLTAGKTGKSNSWASLLRIGLFGTRNHKCAQCFTSRATVLITAREKRAT